MIELDEVKFCPSCTSSSWTSLTPKFNESARLLKCKGLVEHHVKFREWHISKITCILIECFLLKFIADVAGLCKPRHKVVQDEVCARAKRDGTSLFLLPPPLLAQHFACHHF